jgi:DNA replication protein DnaD
MENKNPISDEELQRLAEWLKSDEGREIIREALNKADETCKIIDKMRDIDPEKLREPFTI